MSRKTLKVLSFVTIAIGLVAIVAVLKQHYRTHITISPDKTEFSFRNAYAIDNKFDTNTDVKHVRKLSIPTECYEDGAPSICAGNHEAIKTNLNHTCKCETAFNGKVFAKQYDIKSVYEYTLGIGEDNVVANALSEQNLCDMVCKNFSAQIVNGTFLPREQFTISHKCAEPQETIDKDETKYFAECKCNVTDTNGNTGEFISEKIKKTEFSEKTPDDATARCERWCNKLCDTVFSKFIGENPTYTIITE